MYLRLPQIHLVYIQKSKASACIGFLAVVLDLRCLSIVAPGLSALQL